jgi:hypothetical protein
MPAKTGCAIVRRSGYGQSEISRFNGKYAFTGFYKESQQQIAAQA